MSDSDHSSPASSASELSSNESDSPTHPDLMKGYLDRLRSAVATSAPWCGGSLELPAQDLVLFYAAKGSSSGYRIDFTNTTDDELKRLAGVCEPAVFGVNMESVLDENYRRAGKLDADCFALKFDPICSGLLNRVGGDLLRGRKQTDIRAELYKLNVYGPGSFFKTHKDTPRGGNMFGSLVLVLPTLHTGGELEFHKDTREWVYDTASVVCTDGDAYVAYAAFYSDIEHAVRPVESGYRVTVTYNLYFSDAPAVEGTGAKLYRDPELHHDKLEEAFASLLRDPQVFRKGGLIGFELSYEYPLGRAEQSWSLKERLKGTDVVVMEVCEELGLDVELKVLYDVGGVVMLNYIPEFLEQDLDNEDASEFRRLVVGEGGQVIEWDKWERNVDQWETADGRPFRVRRATPVHWVTDFPKRNKHETPYVTYGNEASLNFVYGAIALIVKIENVENRARFIANSPSDSDSE